MRLMTTGAGLALLLVWLPTYAQDTTWFDNLVGAVATYLSTYLVPLIMILATAAFIWGVAMFVAHPGEEKVREEGKKRIVWGIVGLFVAISVWGIVALIATMVNIQPTTGVQPPGVVPLP